MLQTCPVETATTTRAGGGGVTSEMFGADVKVPDDFNSESVSTEDEEMMHAMGLATDNGHTHHNDNGPPPPASITLLTSSGAIAASLPVSTVEVLFAQRLRLEEFFSAYEKVTSALALHESTADMRREEFFLTTKQLVERRKSQQVSEGAAETAAPLPLPADSHHHGLGTTAVFHSYDEDDEKPFATISGGSQHGQLNDASTMNSPPPTVPEAEQKRDDADNRGTNECAGGGTAAASASVDIDATRVTRRQSCSTSSSTTSGVTNCIGCQRLRRQLNAMISLIEAFRTDVSLQSIQSTVDGSSSSHLSLPMVMSVDAAAAAHFGHSPPPPPIFVPRRASQQPPEDNVYPTGFHRTTAEEFIRKAHERAEDHHLEVPGANHPGSPVMPTEDERRRSSAATATPSTGSNPRGSLRPSDCRRRSSVASSNYSEVIQQIDVNDEAPHQTLVIQEKRVQQLRDAVCVSPPPNSMPRVPSPSHNVNVALAAATNAEKETPLNPVPLEGFAYAPTAPAQQDQAEHQQLLQKFFAEMNSNSNSNSNSASGGAGLQGPSQSFYRYFNKEQDDVDMEAIRSRTMQRKDSDDASVASVRRKPTAFTDKVRHSVDDIGMKMLNDYVLMEHLGAGATGVVKLAFSVQKNELVAIKMVSRPKQRLRKSLGRLGEAKEAALRQEIAVMKKLRHKNIVSLYEVIDDPEAEKMYLVMQYVDKGSVGHVDAEGQCVKLEPHELAEIARQVATGLDYLHSHGVVHRDLKPENILVNENNECFLSDFGAAEEHGGHISSAGVGTPLFMAPELLKYQLYQEQEQARKYQQQLRDEEEQQQRMHQDDLKLKAPDDSMMSSPEPSPTRSARQRKSPCMTTLTVPTHDDDAGRQQQLAATRRAKKRQAEPTVLEEFTFEDGCAADMWALGVTFYCLATGHLPFYSLDEIRAFEGRKLEFPETLSSPLRRLIRLLLSPNPKKRPTAFEARGYIKQVLQDEEEHRAAAAAGNSPLQPSSGDISPQRTSLTTTASPSAASATSMDQSAMQQRSPPRDCNDVILVAKSLDESSLLAPPPWLQHDHVTIDATLATPPKAHGLPVQPLMENQTRKKAKGEVGGERTTATIVTPRERMHHMKRTDHSGEDQRTAHEGEGQERVDDDDGGGGGGKKAKHKKRRVHREVSEDQDHRASVDSDNEDRVMVGEEGDDISMTESIKSKHAGATVSLQPPPPIVVPAGQVDAAEIPRTSRENQKTSDDGTEEASSSPRRFATYTANTTTEYAEKVLHRHQQQPRPMQRLGTTLESNQSHPQSLPQRSGHPKQREHHKGSPSLKPDDCLVSGMDDEGVDDRGEAQSREHVLRDGSIVSVSDLAQPRQGGAQGAPSPAASNNGNGLARVLSPPFNNLRFFTSSMLDTSSSSILSPSHISSTTLATPTPAGQGQQNRSTTQQVTQLPPLSVSPRAAAIQHESRHAPPFELR